MKHFALCHSLWSLCWLFSVPVPVANKRDTRSIEEAMNAIRAKKRQKREDDTGAHGSSSWVSGTVCCLRVRARKCVYVCLIHPIMQYPVLQMYKRLIYVSTSKCFLMLCDQDCAKIIKTCSVEDLQVCWCLRTGLLNTFNICLTLTCELYSINMLYECSDA